MKAMILAAGLGTRLKPFTNEHPKALAEVNDKTLLQRNIEYLKSYGISEIIINIHHFPEQIKRFVADNNSFGIDIQFSDETNEVLETGGGLMRASWFLKDSDPFILMNVDILTDLNLNEMTQIHQKQKNLVTLAVSKRDTSRYFLFDGEHTLCGWENVTTGEKKISRLATHTRNLAFSGLQVVSPEIFNMIHFSGKFSLVAVYLDLAKTQKIGAYNHTGHRFIDVGKPERLLKAEEMFE